MERLSICPLQVGDVLLVKLRENLEVEEEFNIITAKDINAERKNAAGRSVRAVILIQQKTKRKYPE